MDDTTSITFDFSALDNVALESIVSFTLNQQVLSRNFELIISALKTLGHKLSTFKPSSGASNDNSDLLKELQRMVESHENRLGEQEEKINAQEEKIKSQEEHIAQQEQKNREQDQRLTDLEKAYQDLHKTVDLQENKIKEQGLLINSMNAQVHDMREEIDALKKDNGALKQKTENLEKKQDETQQATERNTEEIEKLKDLINALKAQMEVISSLRSTGSGDNEGNSNNNEKLILSLSQKIESTNAKLEGLLRDLEALRRKVDGLGSGSRGGPSISDGDWATKDELRDISKQLRDKVGCDDFDRVLDDIRALNEKINNLPIGGKTEVKVVQQQSPSNAGGPSISTKDMNLLKEFLKKFPNLEEMVRKLRKDFDDHVQIYTNDKQALDKAIDKLREDKLDKSKYKPPVEQAPTNFVANVAATNYDGDIQSLREELDRLLNKILTLEYEQKGTKDKVGILDKQIQDILKLLEALKNMDKGSNAGGNIGDFKNLLNAELEKLREELMGILNDILEKLNKKADMDDLWKSEHALLKKLDEVVEALMKKLADKGETKKALIFLEKKINELFVAIFGGGDKDKEHDALLAKRPLYWSCASCDKDLDNYNGKLGDYKNWAVFPPKETMPERMGRFGTGYAKMMENRKVRIEREKEKEKTGDNLNAADPMNKTARKTFDTSFPDINQKSNDEQSGNKSKLNGGNK